MDSVAEGKSEGGESNRNLIVPFCLPPFARSKQRTHWLVQSSQEEEIQLDTTEANGPTNFAPKILIGSEKMIFLRVIQRKQIWQIWAELAFSVAQGAA